MGPNIYKAGPNIFNMGPKIFANIFNLEPIISFLIWDITFFDLGIWEQYSYFDN